MSTSARISFWNPDRALAGLGGDHDLLRDMMRIFLEEAPKQLQILRKAVETGNSRDAEHAAHRLKGDLGYLKAADAAEWARRLEDAGHNGDLSHAAPMLANLEANLEAIFSTMRTACGDR
jgi:two-component system, sensor histidine kinase and response regulator